jgi:plastocyanin
MKRSNVRRWAPMMVALFLAAFTACGGDDDGTGPGGNGNGNGTGSGTPVPTTSVTLTAGLQFDPADIIVSPGATVTWTWANSTVHNVTFVDGSITSSGNQGGGTFQSVMPSTAGVYNYSCTIHGGMDGSVEVE